MPYTKKGNQTARGREIAKMLGARQAPGAEDPVRSLLASIVMQAAVDLASKDPVDFLDALDWAVDPGGADVILGALDIDQTGLDLVLNCVT